MKKFILYFLLFGISVGYAKIQEVKLDGTAGIITNIQNADGGIYRKLSEPTPIPPDIEIQMKPVYYLGSIINHTKSMPLVDVEVWKVHKDGSRIRLIRFHNIVLLAGNTQSLMVPIEEISDFKYIGYVRSAETQEIFDSTIFEVSF